MIQVKLKEIETGNIVYAWESYDKKAKEYKYYHDFGRKQELGDILLYEAIEPDNSRSPFAMFGIECGYGWYPLIEPVINYINEYNKDKENPEDKIAILQIKEKMSYLEIYTSFTTPRLSELIKHAQEEAQTTCEYCGSREHIGMTQGYYEILCHDCVKEDVVEKNFGSRQWLSYDDDKVYWIHPNKDDELISTYKEYKDEMP